MTVFKKYNGSDWEAIAVGQKGDSGVGVPTGGTTDQVLAKVSATDYDTAWVTLNYVDAAGAVSAIKADADWNATDWDTAYGWGDHAVAGYALSSSLGTIASQDANSVNIDGGAIDATDIGVATPATVSSDNYLTADNYPTIKPSLNLDFANTKTLDPRVTFARASTATYYDGQTVAKAEENLLTYSEEFDNGAGWTINPGVTIRTADVTTAPDGTNTADKLSGTSGGFPRVSSVYTLVPGLDYVASCFIKSAEYTQARLEYYNNNNLITANFDLSNGTIISVNGPNSPSAEIIDAGNGWYRCVLSAKVDAASSLSIKPLPLQIVNTGDGIYIWGAQLEQRDSVAAYTPTTTQPITNYIPVLQTASSGDPRFDHDPITGESKGLLIEEQRTNLLERSQEFDDVYWTKSNLSADSNVIVAPDGATTADKLVENTTSNSIHAIYRTFSVSTTAYTFSIYAKAAGRSKISMVFGASTLGLPSIDYRIAKFDLVAESVLFTPTNGNASISHVGNGWYKCVITITPLASGNPQCTVVILDSSSNDAYTGDGYSGIYIWGAQLEEGSFPTSYIKTEGSQVTRVADSASMTGTNFSNWYRQDEGTVYVEVDDNSINPAGTALDFYGGSQERIEMYYRSPSSGLVFVKANGGNQVIFNGEQKSGKRALGYKTNDTALSIDGNSALTDTVCLMPNITSLYIGALQTSNVQLNRHIKKIAYYPQRLPNATLQALTEE